MVNVNNTISPREEIIKKLIKYFSFTIFFAWTPMLINIFVSFCFDITAKKYYMYTSDICIMTIILPSTNIKDLAESTVPNSSVLFLAHIILNSFNIGLSLIFVAISTYLDLAKIQPINSVPKQFILIFFMYIIAVLSGSCVQIGDVIKWKK